VALDGIVRVWEVEGIADPPFRGEVAVVDDEIRFRYPEKGTGIDREAAIEIISGSIGDPNHPPVELPTRLLEPVVTAADVDRAVERTRALLDGPVTLLNEEHDKEVVVPRDVLGQALRITIDDTAPEPDFEFGIDDGPLIVYLAGFDGYLRTDPVNAEILIDVETDEVTLVPSLPEYRVDYEGIGEAVWDAMVGAGRTAEFPFLLGDEAEFATADAEALGIRGLIGEFTTNHPAGQRRVINIQLMADYVDGVMVMPGETFSVNAHVGRRTVEKGFVCAGALVGIELVEEGPVCIGGGSSQFATTLHNAVFFAGLEHVRFFPHTAWFSRYPEGREATLGFPEPDYVFRNDTDNAVVIRTSYTPTSITVKIYGDNGGRIVEAGLSPRCCQTSIVEVRRASADVGPPHCTPETARQITSGQGGWTVTVYRYITWPDGTETTEEWRVRYIGLGRIFEYNPDHPGCVPPPDPDPGNGNGNEGGGEGG
jgi:vancomycin resistance protein YoaR